MDNTIQFNKWNTLKQTIQNNQTRHYIKEGCVYWVHIGQNIGCEVFGKQQDFRRPVLVLKRIYIPNYMDAFIGIPLTTKKLSGSSFARLTNVKHNVVVTAMLGQIRAFDSRRTISYYYKARKEEVDRVRNKLTSFLSPSN